MLASIIFALTTQAYGIIGTIAAAIVAGTFAAYTARQASLQASRAAAATTEVSMVSETWEQTKTLIETYKSDAQAQRALVIECDLKCVSAVARAEIALKEVEGMRRAVYKAEQQTEILADLSEEIKGLKDDIEVLKSDNTKLRAEIVALRGQVS